MQTICIYCGSSSGFSPVYEDAVDALAQTLAAQQKRIVYGGARVGLMGRIADKMLEQGCEVIGVMPEALVEKEIAHTGLTQLHVVKSMHERKALMAELSDAFIAMPGGMGTLEELFEMLTWGQLGFHQKPCAVYNVDGYYDALLSFIEQSVSQGFVKDVHRQLLLTHNEPAALLTLLENYQAPNVTKWLTKSEL